MLTLLQNNLSRVFKGLLWDSSLDLWAGRQAKSRSSWLNCGNNWMISLTSYWIMRRSSLSPPSREFILIQIIDMWSTAESRKKVAVQTEPSSTLSRCQSSLARMTIFSYSFWMAASGALVRVFCCPPFPRVVWLDPLTPLRPSLALENYKSSAHGLFTTSFIY